MNLTHYRVREGLAELIVSEQAAHVLRYLIRILVRLKLVKLRDDTTRLRTFGLTVISVIPLVKADLIAVVKICYRSFVCCGVLLYVNNHVCTPSEI